MAGSESDELPTLTITNAQLRERSSLLTGKTRRPDDDRVAEPREECSDKSRAGLLYLLPTTVVNTSNDEGKTKKTRRRPQQHEETRSSPKHKALVNQEASCNHGATKERSSRVKDPRSRTTPHARQLQDFTAHQNPHHRASTDTGKRAEKKSEVVTSEEDELKAEWNRHENRKIEKALAKWSGDVAKLDPVIQAW